MSKLLETIAAVVPPDADAMRFARARQSQLTKPTGSLGRLEDLSVQLAGISRSLRPRVEERAIVVMAADHGVAKEGVSAYPQEVTAQMVLNFVRGGAAINVLARQARARVVIVDMGVVPELEPHPMILSRRQGAGTENLAAGPAMSREVARSCIEVGIEVVEGEIAKGLDLVGTGDMGIGNTTASSAVVAALTSARVRDVTGRGTGLDDHQLAHKVAVIERALEVNQPDPRDPLDVLAKVGGFEIGGLAGVILGAAVHRVPIVIDGFISGAAALIATRLCPIARDYLIAAHSSVEIGHRVLLDRMELVPLLNLNLRLGEGTGAALAMHLVEAAARILSEMSTFAEAGVLDREQPASEGVPGGNR